MSSNIISFAIEAIVDRRQDKQSFDNFKGKPQGSSFVSNTDVVIIPSGTSLTDVASLAVAINDAGGSVETITRFNPTAESSDIYYHSFNFGNFPLVEGQALWIQQAGNSYSEAPVPDGDGYIVYKPNRAVFRYTSAPSGAGMLVDVELISDKNEIELNGDKIDFIDSEWTKQEENMSNTFGQTDIRFLRQYSDLLLRSRDEEIDGKWNFTAAPTAIRAISDEEVPNWGQVKEALPKSLWLSPINGIGTLGDFAVGERLLLETAQAGEMQPEMSIISGWLYAFQDGKIIAISDGDSDGDGVPDMAGPNGDWTPSGPVLHSGGELFRATESGIFAMPAADIQNIAYQSDGGTRTVAEMKAMTEVYGAAKAAPMVYTKTVDGATADVDAFVVNNSFLNHATGLLGIWDGSKVVWVGKSYIDTQIQSLQTQIDDVVADVGALEDAVAEHRALSQADDNALRTAFETADEALQDAHDNLSDTVLEINQEYQLADTNVRNQLTLGDTATLDAAKTDAQQKADTAYQNAEVLINQKTAALEQNIRTRTAHALADSNVDVNNPGTIDGVNAINGRLYALTNQTDSLENGLRQYDEATNTLVLPAIMEIGDQVGGTFIVVSAGATYDNTRWIVSNNEPNDVVGTDALVIEQIYDSVTYQAGGTMKQTGKTFDSKTKVAKDTGVIRQANLDTTRFALSGIPNDEFGVVTDEFVIVEIDNVIQRHDTAQPETDHVRVIEESGIYYVSWAHNAALTAVLNEIGANIVTYEVNYRVENA